VLDCDYPVDAGAALVITTLERARDLRRPPVVIDAISLATQAAGDPYRVPDMATPVPPALVRRLWARSRLTAADLDLACPYDGFGLFALQWLEALGICPAGEGAAFVADGHATAGSRLPLNPDGGAANIGRRHGASYFIEAVQQLRGRCGARQVPAAATAVVTNGIGGHAGAAVLRRDGR
jgi:acetyl-CoA acetyltransferase